MTATKTMATPQVSFDESFWATVAKLQAVQGQRIIEALLLFQQNPTHPNLKLKPLKRGLSELMSLRAGRDVRVLLVRRGDTYIWLEAGLRRDVYEKAERGSFVVHPNRRFIGFVDRETEPEDRRHPLPTGDNVRDIRPGVFDHWKTAELAAVGFTDTEIASLRNVGDEYALLELPWAPERVDLAIRLLEITPEQWSAGESDAGAEQRMREAIADFGGLTGVSPLLTPEQLAALAAAPVEDWMIFLHPDQVAVVERSFDGPARIRGSAGTGKTVVALHRAAVLARRLPADEGRILFTTFGDSMMPVLGHLFARLPGAPTDRVDFITVNDLAQRLLDESGEPPTVDGAAVDEAFETAHKRVVQPGSPVDRLGCTAQYLREEITQVLKGRGIDDRDEYRSVVRTGRRVGFTRAVRDQVWELAIAWDEEKATRNTVDGADLILMALRAATSSILPRWRSALIDEAQDLTLAALQLVRAVTNERVHPSDSLLIAGDGAQRVLPGGYTLRQAGVEVRGRTVVLRVNYRNTAATLRAAMAIAGGEQVTDLDEEFRRGETAPIPIREGRSPVLLRADSADHQYDLIADRLRTITGDPAIGWGDIAVFSPDETSVESALVALSTREIPTLLVRDYRGIPTPHMKVGTYADAKGLEFKIVVLPGLTEAVLAGRPLGESDQEREERRSLEMSRLFVAMTRARDLLILASPGPPPSALARAAQHFEMTS